MHRLLYNPSTGELQGAHRKPYKSDYILLKTHRYHYTQLAAYALTGDPAFLTQRRSVFVIDESLPIPDKYAISNLQFAEPLTTTVLFPDTAGRFTEYTFTHPCRIIFDGTNFLIEDTPC